MRENPKVSICVSVYNTEKYLSAFLDSAVQQSFHDYEIVIADNHSTDHSMEILRKYEKSFPDKIVVVLTSEHGGAGKGRNCAFQNSKGEYIYWCDADDIIHPYAVEKLYLEAVRYDADMVCGYALRVDERDGEIQRLSDIRHEKTRAVNNETAIMSGTFFWLRLIKRSLIEKYGLMPEDIIMEDIRYLAPLNSYAEKICFFEFPVYYWYRRGASTTFTVRKELCEDEIMAEQDALVLSNPKYIETTQCYIASRSKAEIETYWQFFDLFVKWVKEQAAWFYENSLIIKNQSLFRFLRWAENLAETECPNIIYVDGFTETPDSARITELKEKVFHDGCSIVVLSEDNCNINENRYVKQAYDEGKLSIVSGYFALKNIHENGGIFIHKHINILNFFGYLKYQNAFFSLLDNNTYSEWIYGSPAGNEAVAAILKTFSDEWDKHRKYLSLADRIAIVLTGKYGIPLDGKARMYHSVVSVIPADLSVVDTRYGSESKKCAFEHDFSDLAGEPEYITIPRVSLRDLLKMEEGRAKENVVKGSLNKEGHPSKSKRELELERELSELHDSNLWKMMQKLRRIGDGPRGAVYRKIFHSFLRFRKKFKHKQAV